MAPPSAACLVLHRSALPCETVACPILFITMTVSPFPCTGSNLAQFTPWLPLFIAPAAPQEDIGVRTAFQCDLSLAVDSLRSLALCATPMDKMLQVKARSWTLLFSRADPARDSYTFACVHSLEAMPVLLSLVLVR